MCLAIPGKVIKREEMLATVDIEGVTREISLMLLPEAQVGEYVLVHAGFAVQMIDEEEALATLELFKELAMHEKNDGR